MFRTAECTFRSGEYTFRSGECTFRSAEYKPEAAFSQILNACVRTSSSLVLPLSAVRSSHAHDPRSCPIPPVYVVIENGSDYQI